VAQHRGRSFEHGFERVSQPVYSALQHACCSADAACGVNALAGTCTCQRIIMARCAAAVHLERTCRRHAVTCGTWSTKTCCSVCTCLQRAQHVGSPCSAALPYPA
jgi:hypothetical protein